MRSCGRLVLLLLVGGCAAEDDFAAEDVLTPVEQDDSKEDGSGRGGPLIATNTSPTQVWYATNKWEDTTTAAAKAAGIAWPANSGLNWDQKYVRWIDSLETANGTDGYTTIRVTTPWGKTMPAPVLECAETAIFLRASFAAWYKLPFFMEASDSQGRRVYFGHFGIRTSAGKWMSTPDFALKYADYSTWTAADLAARGWPSDAALRARVAAGGDDFHPDLDDAHFGAYLDEAHLNKRAGHFIIYLLNYLGSMNVAATVNTYNIVPESLRAGDLLLHRWQKNGVGDTKIIKVVARPAAGPMTARVMSGSIPRRQPKLYDEVASKGYFTRDDTGGVGTSGDGYEYWKLGGGAKRWRVTKNIGGYWTNTWMAADEASWINSTDKARISARPEQFRALLGEVAPAEKKAALERQIADARAHLRRYPASCAARERRERAFGELYALAPALGTTRDALDRDHRLLEDYVFAELNYPQSKTCCWNSSTAAMAEIILDYADDEQASMCRAPTVFKAEAGGYSRWADYATQTGRGSLWRAWSEDESCPQRGVANDVALASQAGDWCEL